MPASISFAPGQTCCRRPPRQVFANTRLIRSIGLKVPEPVSLMQALKERNWHVRTDITDVDEAFNEIVREIGKAEVVT